MRKRNNRRPRGGCPTAILVADFHLRSDTPDCRTDDLPSTQIQKMDWLSELQADLDVPVLAAGDFFDKWKPSPELLATAQYHLPEKIYGIPGNHDLPAHSIDEVGKSGYEVLKSSETVVTAHPCAHYIVPDFSIRGFYFGEKLAPCDNTPDSGRKVAMIHEFVYCGRKPRPGQLQGVTSLVKRLSGYDLILVGDNHRAFTARIGRTLVVNPGCFSRQTSAFVNYRPRVYLWYAEDNTVEPVYIPIKPCVQRSASVKSRTINKRVEEFAMSLSDNFEIGVVFEDNIRAKMEASGVRKSVKKRVMEVLDEC